MTFFMASSFATGSVPGWAVHVGQMLIFGRFSSGSFLQPQNIFEFVLSSACISNPIVGLYFILFSLENYKRIIKRVLFVGFKICSFYFFPFLLIYFGKICITLGAGVDFGNI